MKYSTVYIYCVTTQTAARTIQSSYRARNARDLALAMRIVQVCSIKLQIS